MTSHQLELNRQCRNCDHHTYNQYGESFCTIKYTTIIDESSVCPHFKNELIKAKKISDRFNEVIYQLCYKLDEMLYFPFKDKFKELTNFGVMKENYKILIENEINKLRDELKDTF